MHLTAVEDTLARVLENPVLPGLDRVVLDRVEEDSPYGLLHLFLKLSHPILNILADGIDDLVETNPLLLGTEHRQYGLVTLQVKLDLIDVLEDLVQIRLHCEGLLGLRQYL